VANLWDLKDKLSFLVSHVKHALAQYTGKIICPDMPLDLVTVIHEGYVI